MKTAYRVIMYAAPTDPPREYELSAALILARHFKMNVIFLRPELGKTPDLEINGSTWEIKSPTGSAKRTIENNLRTARKQSQNIVIDLRRSSLHEQKAIAYASFYLKTGAGGIKKLKIITKKAKVIDIL